MLSFEGGRVWFVNNKQWSAAEAEADMAFLDRMGFTEKLEEWWELCLREED